LQARHILFRTTIALALAEALVHILARRRKEWISLPKQNRVLEAASVYRRDDHGWSRRTSGASRENSSDV
jgi:hypothetical protein